MSGYERIGAALLMALGVLLIGTGHAAIGAGDPLNQREAARRQWTGDGFGGGGGEDGGGGAGG